MLVLMLGPIAAGATAAASTHFDGDRGTCYFVVRHADGRTTDGNAIGTLLGDNGPFTYDVTVGPADVCHVNWDVASKGAGTEDLTLPAVP